MNKKSLTSAPSTLQRRSLRLQSMLNVLLITALALIVSGCQSAPVVQPLPPRLTPPPQELMQKREPNLRQRLRQLSTGSPQTGTPPSGSSPASKPGQSPQ